MRAFALLGLLFVTSTFALDGGLDFQKHSLFAQPGTLSDCCNFERGVTQGYNRIDGLISFDGFEEPVAYSSTITLRMSLIYGDLSEGISAFAPGGYVAFATGPIGFPETYPSVSNWYLITAASTTTDATYRYYTITVENPFNSPLLLPSNATALAFKNDPAPGDSTSAIYYEGSGELITIVNDIGPTNVENAANSMVPVPGRTDSDVHFTHLYNDDVYAGRDYEAYELTGTNATASVTFRTGDIVTNGEAFATVILAEGAFGFEARGKIIVHREHGKFAVDDTLYVVRSGSYQAPMTQGGLHGPVSAIFGGWMATEVGKVTALTDETRAGLYRTLTTGGWTEVDQLREVRFSAGQSAMSALVGVLRGSQLSNVTVSNIGPKYPTVAKRLVGFTSVENVTADDASATSCASLASFDRIAMKATGFDFADVPVNANIVGIEVTIERKASALDTGSDPQWVQDNRIHLLGVGTTGILIGTLESALLSANNKAATTEKWGTSYVAKTYGSASDLWGQAIDPAAIRSPDFGVYVECLRSIRSGGSTSDTAAEIDYIRMKVYYQDATSRVHFYNANGTPTNISGDVIATHLITGSYATDDAEGILTVKMDSPASLGRNAEIGDQIRSGEGPAGGVLYATVSSPMIPVTLPSQSELDAEGSMYRTINANFYGSEDLEGAYFANGAGPAFALDKFGLVRIHPDLSSDLNKPRHLAQHGDYLALAYKNGSVLFSKAGEPLNMRGVEGATEVAFGSRVTGLLPLNKDALGVFCQSVIFALRGLDSSNFQERTKIRPNTGAVEYTVVDMGLPVYCNPFGIDWIVPTDAYGDFRGDPLSDPVWPWLRPRIQALSSDANLRVKFAYPVRNKNQYRVVFGDGYAMTMTLVGPQREPQFTIQRWHYDDGTTDAIFVPRHISSAIDSQGKERIFATMAYSAQWNLEGQQYVYEVDKLWFFTFWNGTSFDARPIQSHIVTNWNDERNPAQLKRFDLFHVFGRSQFPVTFDMGRANNYQLTTDASGDATNMVDCSFGVSGEIVPPIAYNRMTTAHLAIEGFNVALRFESNDADTPQFTLSAVMMTSDNRGPSRGQMR